MVRHCTSSDPVSTSILDTHKQVQPALDGSGFSKLQQPATLLPELDGILHRAVCELDISVTAAQQRQLLLYLDKLLLWNKAYNLTAITEPTQALIKHLLDCLAILPHLPAGDLLDIGTGAGLPGVVIAICQPDRSCTLLDSNQKKIRFIRQVASELALGNVRPVASRIEDYQGQHALITSRAFASLSDFVDSAHSYLAPGGRLCAMKGKAPSTQEVYELQQTWHIHCKPLHVPQLSDSRHLIELCQKTH